MVEHNQFKMSQLVCMAQLDNITQFNPNVLIKQQFMRTSPGSHIQTNKQK